MDTISFEIVMERVVHSEKNINIPLLTNLIYEMEENIAEIVQKASEYQCFCCPCGKKQVEKSCCTVTLAADKL